MLPPLCHWEGTGQKLEATRNVKVHELRVDYAGGKIIQQVCRPNGFLNMSPQSIESDGILLREIPAQFSHKESTDMMVGPTPDDIGDP
ncbi:hypothetical protein Y1Q_0017761 [Alligator mississippiensis]|uniref:Uncharacterized protein n=1 Tax=Alligator mississippiensis TaxID=8496 RepID=A0A151MJG8_ALLMI|nr:hypothetical protein Y1Q_0017761 [Alligator mississippiensis]